MDVPEDFLKELKNDKSAYAFFKTLNKSQHVCYCLAIANREKAGDPSSAYATFP